jgi:REP element-mobilizing transposase RayT
MYVHIIFSTKHRFPFIKPDIENELYSYIGGVIKQNGGIPFKINSMPDHIHILSTLPKNISLSKFLEEIKRNSSRWIKLKGDDYKKFAWQGGYCALSVSSSVIEKVKIYISNQKEHHKKSNFKQELIKFLEKYDLAYDERYLWD